MLTAMTAMLKDLLSSKKFFVAMISTIAWVLGRLGWHVDAIQMTEAVMPLYLFVIAQGVADHGKEAARIAIGAGIATSPGTADAGGGIVRGTMTGRVAAINIAPTPDKVGGKEGSS